MSATGVRAEDRRARFDEEREAIIRSAHRLIGRSGQPTPIEDILRGAGVNRRVFYRHFPSKDALLLAMQERAGRLVADALRAAVAGSDDGRAAATAWIREFLGIGWDERRSREGRTFVAPEVGMVPGIAAAMEEIHVEHRRILETALARGREDGTLPSAAPERNAFAIHAVVLRCLEMRARGLLMQPFAEVYDEIVDVLVALTTVAVT